MRPTSAARLGALAVSAVFLLAGCSSGPSTEAPASTRDPAEATETAPEPADALITCADIEPLAAPITAGFVFSPDDSSEDSSGTTCVWINDAVASASTALEDYASLAVGIDGTTWSADELRTLAGATDDPRAEALDGRVLLLGEGDTLGEVGSVQLLSPRGTVTIVATGMLLAASADTAIPVDAALDVAADVGALRR
ncbi:MULTISPECIES: hypothetical protein [unclassified Microbacterium]|uniref:hypothetical protein n=1 Tax=unclassified Microbacterium TaxID=2609290 RepID=UPI0030198BA2